jgi:CBS-domain-containing membrane protein
MSFDKTIIVVIAVCALLAIPVVAAQTRKYPMRISPNQPTESEVKEVAERIAKAQADVVAAAKDYKTSLEKLLAFQKQDVTTAQQEIEKRKALRAQQIISEREVQQSEQMLAAAQAKVSETQKQLQESENLISETTAMAGDPITEARKLLAEKKKRERTDKGRVYYVRFIIIGEMTIYDYSGAVTGQVIKQGQQIKYDSRKSY